MQECSARRQYPELRQLVIEASHALARLDASRLEELALCCRALNRDQAAWNGEDRAQLASQARDASGNMAVFARVLDVTRSNLKVINRLRALQAGRLEYCETPGASGPGWLPAGGRHGDN